MPLGDVADVAIAPTPNEIQRENASRRIDVTCNVQRARSRAASRARSRRACAAFPFDRGYHPEFLGEYAARAGEPQPAAAALALLALLGILLLLHADFQSLAARRCWCSLTLPFALIGGVAGAFLGGGVLSLGSLVGFVTVLGIAARNGIMLVSHYRHLEETEGEPFGRELVLRGAEERLAPILMTALATGAGAACRSWPAATGPGHEIEHPMAVVILGGLVTSTVLNLFLMPALYLRFGMKGPR